jgi:Mn-dependent DtxR family transcriptional regulator
MPDPKPQQEPAAATPKMEDYLERIYHLMQEKGYARVVDIAALLDVQSPSVTRMIRKLAEQGFVEYERYRGIVLTDKGTALGRRMKRRHKGLEDFLRVLGIEDEEIIWKDVEGIEHHVSPITMDAIRSLVAFFQETPRCLDQLRDFQRDRATARARERRIDPGSPR